MDSHFRRACATLGTFVVIFFLSLIAGCGGASTQASNSSGAPAPAPSPSPVASPAPSPGPSPSPSPSPSPTPAGGVPRSAHVVLVIEENHSFAEVLSSMPWLVNLGDTYAFANNYHADAVGSALDYFWLSSGSGEQAFGCTGNGCTRPITSDNIFRELASRGIRWKVYADSLPHAGYMGGNTGAYVDRHNPAKWYSDVIDSPQLQQNIVPFTQFAVDLAAGQLPAYSLIIPDVNHDAHNGTLAEADTWLKDNLSTLLSEPFFQAGGDGLMIVTFDECDAALGNCPEQVYTAVAGPRVKRHFQSGVLYRHENTLRTMLDALGVNTDPGASATAASMADFFQ